jgi:NAD(P)-dependent dehydrogenase (short-subunit alcohol dehydrogenase family)
MIPSLSGAVTVITGASSGIGLAAAHAYAASGSRVVLSARNGRRLHEEAADITARGGEAMAVPADVTSDEQVVSLMEAVRERWGRLDLLVCNAGVGLYGPVAEIPEPALRQVFEVNFFGVVRCIQRAVPLMRAGGGGLIQIVSSVIGRRAVPLYGGYCASKSALQGMADALRLEVAPDGIHVQMFYPALTETDFSRNCLIGPPEPPPPRMRPTPAREVARQMVLAARRRSREHIVSASGRALVRLSGVAPSVVDALLTQVMLSGPDGRAVRRRRK